MPSFSQKSMDQLDTCDPRLQVLFLEVVRTYDCTVIQGYRTPEEQLALYNARPQRSKIKAGGPHNFAPSRAVDVAPWIRGRGIPWPQPGSKTYIKDLLQFAHFAGYVECKAHNMGIEIINGGDWDRDHDLTDQSFDDWPHFQLGTEEL